jgi:hypothetical protein
MNLALLFLRSSDGRPIAWCVIGFCVGIYLFIHGFRLLQRRHLILNTPVSKIRSASMGVVELNGLAVGPYTIVAPITARPCYFHRTLVWEWKRQGRSSKWVKVAGECKHVPFFLDDNTGKVMVDPRDADLDLHCDFQEQFCDSFFTTKEEAPGNVRDFLLRHGISTTNKIKVEEFCIKPKNALFLLGSLDDNPGITLSPEPIWDDDVSSVLGRTRLSLAAGVGSGLSGALSLTGGLQHDPAYDAIYDEAKASASARVIRLSAEHAPEAGSGMTQQEKIAAALLKAGISNPAAWQAAKVTPSQAAATSQAPIGSSQTAVVASLPQAAQKTYPSLDEFEANPPVILMKGKNNPTFLISWRSQREVARSLGWKCTLMIWGGPALSLVCLYGLHLLTNWF